MPAQLFGDLLLNFFLDKYRLPLGFLSNKTVENILGCVACVLGSMGLLFFRSMKCGYDENTPDSSLLPRQTVVQSITAVLLYGAVTVLLGYGTAGAATNIAILAPILAKAIADVDTAVTIQRLAQEYGGWMLLSLVIQTLPFMPAILGGYAVGGMRRRKSRAALYENRK